MKFKIISTVFFLTALMTAGCAQKADPNRPLEQVKKEAETMSVAQLESYAQAYAKEINIQRAGIAKIAEEMKKLPVKDIFSDKSKSVQNRLIKTQSKASALLDRYQIYVAKLKEKGGDLAKVRIL